MKKTLFLVFSLIFLFAVLSFPCFGVDQPGAEDDVYQIAYLSPSFDISDAWERIWVSMKYRLDELGVNYDLITLATSSHVAHDEQLAQVESVIMRGVDYVMLGPTAFDACVPALKALKEAGVPAVVYNYTEAHKDPEAKAAVLQYIGFDHGVGGRMVGEWIVDHLDGKGKVAIIYGAPGPISDGRGGEAKKIMQKTDIEIVFEYYADFNRMKGYEATNDLLMAEPDVDVIYACSTTMALGAASAVAEIGKSDQIAIIGFGCTGEELDAICNGTMAGSPLRMIDDSGVGVADAFYAHMQGKKIPQIWSGPFIMVDNCEEGRKHYVAATRISKPVMGY
ncbi:MAG: substrate-binding domain-containing protein [Spirochaetes bacterium]|nr:substrate-binding domain-containing protein [Spirochaetota bacterium]